MELRHLRYFTTVAEYGSMRMASDRLHISQPAISRQIHDLEAELRVRLFDRTARGLVLTRAGERYLIEVHRILSMIEAAGRSARMVMEGKSGRLAVGLVEIASWEGLIPAALGEFRRRHEAVDLHLHPATTPELLRAVEDGELDGAFVYAFDPLPETIASTRLTQHGVVLAVPQNWHGNTRADVSARDLVDEPFVTFQRAIYPTYYDNLIHACACAGLTLRVVQEMSSEAAMLSLVSADVGLAVVNSCNRWRAPSRVTFLALSDLAVALPLSFVRLAGNSNPALTHFEEILKRAATEMPTGEHLFPQS
ncbi:LysR family transcriptional regulator [Castellaniella caeni]|uniref:LysR family transcriptional regulator n=1 Tax=Castellaniella caeni TaxID=266123 RepID=UPI000C9F9AED|nr:LysR family transcriptional regulator [Castellaniella caeni]